MNASRLSIQGYEFSVSDRKLVISNPEQLEQPISIIFSPAEASRLSVLLNKLVPDDYGVRNNFRVPVLSKFRMRARIAHNEFEADVDITSISLSGLYAKWKSDASRPQTEKGHLFQVAIVFQEHGIEVGAVVTRESSSGVGLAFTHNEPSTELSNLVMAVQRNWIASNNGEL